MPEAAPKQRHVILLAEDEPGIRGALELLLGLEGYDVVSASNGVQALDALPHAACDLIITDHMMPLMDGPTFLRHVRADERFRHVPAIMISAVPRPPETLEPLADAFIGKPFEIPVLLQAIRSLLQHDAGASANG